MDVLDRRTTVLILTLIVLFPTVAWAQAPTSDHQSDSPTEIVLLGTSHFAGSALDAHTSEVGDLLSPARQQELDAVARQITDWDPDRFFVECMPDDQSHIDSLYAAYRADDYVPTEAGDRNEIYQLGFRAADQANLDRTRCVDAAGIWLGAQARQVAETHNPAVVDSLNRLAENRLSEEDYLRDHTLGEYLLELNTDRRLWENHKAYNYYFARMGSFDDSGMKSRREGDLEGQTFAFTADAEGNLVQRARHMITEMNGRIVDEVSSDADYVVVSDREIAAEEVSPEAGADTLSLRELGNLIQRNSTTWISFPDHHIGADLVGEWYKRNLRTYANIWRAVEADDDRVILLTGQAHVWTLRQFFRENPDFEVMPVSAVLQ